MMPLAQSVTQTNVMQGRRRKAAKRCLRCHNTLYLYLLLITFDRKRTVNKELLSLLSSGSQTASTECVWCFGDLQESKNTKPDATRFLGFLSSQHLITSSV